jgi:hypothetical protein
VNDAIVSYFLAQISEKLLVLTYFVSKSGPAEAFWLYKKKAASKTENE